MNWRISALERWAQEEFGALFMLGVLSLGLAGGLVLPFAWLMSWIDRSTSIYLPIGIFASYFVSWPSAILIYIANHARFSRLVTFVSVAVALFNAVAGWSAWIMWFGFSA